MKEDTVKSILKKYVAYRNERNPLEKAHTPKWNEIKHYTMSEFSDFINSFPYKADPLWGIIDYTDHPDMFFKEGKLFGRDCDDFARLWTLWGLENNYTAHEYIVLNPKRPFRSAHVITILEKTHRYTLCNYEPYGGFNSLLDALDFMHSWSIYKTDLIYEHSHTYHPEELL